LHRPFATPLSRASGPSPHPPSGLSTARRGCRRSWAAPQARSVPESRVCKPAAQPHHAAAELWAPKRPSRSVRQGKDRESRGLDPCRFLASGLVSSHRWTIDWRHQDCDTGPTGTKTLLKTCHQAPGRFGPEDRSNTGPWEYRPLRISKGPNPNLLRAWSRHTQCERTRPRLQGARLRAAQGEAKVNRTPRTRSAGRQRARKKSSAGEATSRHALGQEGTGAPLFKEGTEAVA